ncbi:MAG: GntR family transcriptional regulator [Ruminococcus sp.]|nr:GntR family transcriptional regulator [Ruminococcus sp.]
MGWKFDDAKPIYLQIAERIREQIASGELAPGGKIPTVREIAETAGVNPNTVQRALSDLESAALVASERGNGGRFVTENSDILEKLKHDLAHFAAADYIAKMNKLGFDKAAAGKYLREFKEEQ